MKRSILAVLFLCLLCLPALAQQSPPPEKFIAAGLAFFQSASPQIQGWGALAMPINARVISYTDYDVAALPGVPVVGQKYTLPKLQYSMRTGFGVRIYQVSPKITLWGLGGAGLAADGDATVGAFSGGGFLDFAIGKGWGAVLILEVNRSAITGTDIVPRFGVRKRL